MKTSEAIKAALSNNNNAAIKILLDTGQTYNVNESSSANIKITKILFNQEILDLTNAITFENNTTFGNGKIISFFIKYGSNVNTIISSANGTDYSLLAYAADLNNPKILQLLLNAKAGLEFCGKSKVTPLMLANLECKEILLRSGANPNHVSANGRSVLSYVHSTQEITLLLQSGAQLNYVNSKGEGVVRIAAAKNEKENLDYFLKLKAPFHTNIRSEVQDVIKTLFNVNLTSLKEAIEQDNVEVIKFLLQYKINLSLPTNINYLYYAISVDSKEAIDYFILNGGDLLEISDSLTTLHLVAKTNNDNLVNKILQTGVNINAKDKFGNTALFLAASNGSKSVLNALLQMKASFDIYDEYTVKAITNTLFQTPCKTLVDALKSQNKSVIDFFLKNNFNMEKLDAKGNTSLLFACETNNTTAGIYLIKHGAKIVALTQDKNTPLHLAARNNNVTIVKELLQKGASKSIKNKFAQTPDISAALSGASDVLNILKENNSLFKTVVNEFSIQGQKSIIFTLQKSIINLLGAKLTYKTASSEHIDWLSKESEIKKALAHSFLSLSDNHNGFYELQVYSESNEARMVRELLVKDKEPIFHTFAEIDNTSYMFFKKTAGVTLENWFEQKQYIEDSLDIPVEITEYDNKHKLWGKFGDEKLIVIEESNISVLPDKLKLGGKFLKADLEDGFKVYHFTDILYPSIWINATVEIVKMLNMRVDVIEENGDIKLKESIEQMLPHILDVKDSKTKQFPLLEKIMQDSMGNRVYLYSNLANISINDWKEQSKQTSFKTLFNEPDRVYKLNMFESANKDKFADYTTVLYSRSENNDHDKQYIALFEFAKIPSIADLETVNIIDDLMDDKIFWGYGNAGVKYYTDLNETTHTMQIGKSGSGKSNLMNGLILSLLYNIEKIDKLYLFDLKDGVEFEMYGNLDASKVKVFGDETTPTQLLSTLRELEAEMRLRNAYIKSIGEKKLTSNPIYFIIDEFSQVEAMDEMSNEDYEAKEQMMTTLQRLAKLARNTNIKMFIQSQKPSDISSGISTQLGNRVLLQTLDDNDNYDVLGDYSVKHQKFLKGRYAFLDGNTNELNEFQFPFVDPKHMLHMHYAERANDESQSLDANLEQFKEQTRQKYPALANTKVLGGTKVKVKLQEVQETQHIEEIQDVEEIDFDIDFDFDALESDEPELNEQEIDEFTEIANLNNDSLNILKELQEGAN